MCLVNIFIKGISKIFYVEGHQEDSGSDSDSNPRPDLDPGLESLKKRIFDKLNSGLQKLHFYIAFSFLETTHVLYYGFILGALI